MSWELKVGELMQKVMLMRLICIMYNHFKIESQLEPQPCIFSYCIRLKHVLCFFLFLGCPLWQTSFYLYVLKQTVWKMFVAHSMQQDIVEMNNECTVHLSLPPGSFCQTVPLAGEEAARVVSTERHLVTLPLPSRVKVLFTTRLHNSTSVLQLIFL